MTKYGDMIPDDHSWEEEPEPDPPNAPVEVGRHTLTVKDESDAIERYNGIKWYFPIEDGKIFAVQPEHYCPGPGHTDPMDYRRWDEVPDRVQRVVLRELRASDPEEVVDFENVNEMADAWGDA